MVHSMPNCEVSAVIPCLNEEKTLGICINKALDAFKRLRIAGEVVVADNGSSDASVEIATRLGARVVRVTERGYGAALIAGINAARGTTIIMADADDSYDWSEIGPFIEKINEGYDLVMGNRFKGGIEPGAMPILHKYLGNPVLSGIARITFKSNIGDFHCGMRAFRKNAIQSLGLKCTGMEFATEMIANAIRHQIKISEIPTKLYIDKRDRPPHLRSFRDGWRHLRFILLYAPDHLFLIPGLALMFLGLLLVLSLSLGSVTLFGQYFGTHYLALGSLLSIIGYNIIWMGIFAKTIVASRFKILETPLIRYFSSHFKLETGLVPGTILALLGFGIDLYVLAEWASNTAEPMEDTIHPAFAATTFMAIGIITIFNSFLISLKNEFANDS